MKTLIIITSLLLLLLFGGYYVFTKTAEPKAIELFMPVKLRMIPLGEKFTTVSDYLGAPNTSKGSDVQWLFPITTNKQFVLNGTISDSVLTRYSLWYEVKIWGFTRDKLVRSDTLR